MVPAVPQFVCQAQPTSCLQIVYSFFNNEQGIRGDW